MSVAQSKSERFIKWYETRTPEQLQVIKDYANQKLAEANLVGGSNELRRLTHVMAQVSGDYVFGNAAAFLCWGIPMNVVCDHVDGIRRIRKGGVI